MSVRCPVCVRPVHDGMCADHGPWQPHQVVRPPDVRRSAHVDWIGFRPAAQACPRCLAPVAGGGNRFTCVEHAGPPDAHGPFRCDELLGPTAQREAARHRARLARRVRAERRPSVAVALPDLTGSMRLAGGVSIVAATLTYLLR